jgi:hypothetical protein
VEIEKLASQLCLIPDRHIRAVLYTELVSAGRHCNSESSREFVVELSSGGSNLAPDAALKIAGIEIPFKSPLLLTLLAVHVLAGLVCVVTGIVAMLSRKRPGRHPRFGTIYYWGLAVLFTTATVLAATRWTEDHNLVVLGLISLAAASLGRTAQRRRWRKWARVHISSMGSSYIFMLIAFYVDNGKSLPLWKDLPRFTYWLLPALFGTPLIVWALVRYRRFSDAAAENE